MSKGFITPLIIGCIVVATLVLVVGSFGAYKFNQFKQEKNNLALELDKQKDERIKQLEEELVKTNDTKEQDIATTTDILSNEADETVEPEVRTVVQEKIVYVPKTEPEPKAQLESQTEPEPKAQLESQTEPEPKAQLESESETEPKIFQQQTNISPISVVSVRQTAYPDGYGGVYGAYELTLRVQPQSGDIYIPMTTTDSVGNGKIGFSYSIVGPEFRGTQDSKVSDCTNFNDNLCKFKIGQDKTITTTVWLTPDSESNGNYAVNFERVTYYEGGVEKQFMADKQTSKINIHY